MIKKKLLFKIIIILNLLITTDKHVYYNLKCFTYFSIIHIHSVYF